MLLKLYLAANSTCKSIQPTFGLTTFFYTQSELLIPSASGISNDLSVRKEENYRCIGEDTCCRIV